MLWLRVRSSLRRGGRPSHRLSTRLLLWGCTVPCSFPATKPRYLLCSSALGPSAQALSRSGAPELFPGGGTGFWQGTLPASALLRSLSFLLPVSSRVLVGEVLGKWARNHFWGSVLRLLCGEGDTKGAKRLPGQGHPWFPTERVCLLTVASGVCPRIPRCPCLCAHAYRRWEGCLGVPLGLPASLSLCLPPLHSQRSV